MSVTNLGRRPLPDDSGFDIESRNGVIRLFEGEKSDVPHEISYWSRLNMTGETTFTENGTITFREPEGLLHFTSVGAGGMEPSSQEGALQGSVIWRLSGGEGRLARADCWLLRLFSNLICRSLVSFR